MSEHANNSVFSKPMLSMVLSSMPVDSLGLAAKLTRIGAITMKLSKHYCLMSKRMH